MNTICNHATWKHETFVEYCKEKHCSVLFYKHVHHHHHHNRFTALFPGPPGWAGARRELPDLWCKGRLTEADTQTIRLGATPSRLTSAHLHHPPHFFYKHVQLCQKGTMPMLFWVQNAALLFHLLLPLFEHYEVSESQSKADVNYNVCDTHL